MIIRRATRKDIRAIVAIHNEDEFRRSAPEDLDHLPDDYARALEEIDRDANNQFWVAEVDEKIVGGFQLTFIRHLMARGALIAQVESVHVATSARSRGIGEAMMRFAISEAKKRGCLRVQLTSQSRRTRAHAFYERLGFVKSHVGMKLYL